MRDDYRNSGAPRCNPRQEPDQGQLYNASPQSQANLRISDTGLAFDTVFPEYDIPLFGNLDGNVSMQECMTTLGHSYGLGMENRANNGSTTTSGSLISVGSPSIVTENGSGSLVVRSVESSDDRQYSIPDEDQAVDKVANTEYLEENPGVVPHDPKYILSSLYSSASQPIHNQFQPLATGENIYYECDQIVSQCTDQAFENPPLLASVTVQNALSDPWSPMYPQVSGYTPAFTAFAPSPRSTAGQDQEDVSSISQLSPSFSSSQTSTQSPSSSGRKSSPSKLPGKRKRKPPLLGWEHTTVFNGNIARVIENAEAVYRRSGVRRGKMDPEAAEKARRIRKLRACWNCWTQKIPCSEEKTCNKCAKAFSSKSYELCCRAGFKDYTEAFFPEFLHAHLNKRDVENLIAKHITGFTDTYLEVEVSTGEVFSPMVLPVNVFKPKTLGLLKHTRLARADPVDKEQDLQAVEMYSAPVGILFLELQEMRSNCKKHIEDMIKNPQYVAQVTAGDRTPLPRGILEIVFKYSSSTNVPLVRNALKLHAMHYFMSSLVTFSHKSASDIYEALRIEFPPLPNTSSRLLNRQVKFIMHQLHRELTADVLKNLEKSVRSREKDSWAPSFCTILILCLCIEGLQIAADTMVVCFLLNPATNTKYARDQSYEACLALDQNPFHQCMKVFHGIHHTHKEGNGGGKDGGFNPLKALQNGERMYSDAPTRKMVEDMYQLIYKSTPEIVELAQRQALIEFAETVEPHAIRDNNTGRLASKFLRSFFVEE